MPVAPALQKEQEDEELRWYWATDGIQSMSEPHKKRVAQQPGVWDVIYLENISLEYDTNAAMF